jgi:hypothetical protein
MNGPYMKSAVPAGQYRLDPYFAVLLTQIEGLGPARLLHVLVVYKAGEADPVFFVTAEIERPSTASPGAPTGSAERPAATPDSEPWLCIFAEDGTHSHLERSPKWADLEMFSTQAVAIVKQRYGVTEITAPGDGTGR